MSDPLTDYIKHYLAQGYSKEQLKAHLISQGHQPEAIDLAFKASAQPSHHLILLFVPLIIFLFLGWVVYIALFNSTVQQADLAGELAEISEKPDREALSAESSLLSEPSVEVSEPPASSPELPFCDTKECGEEYFAECVPAKGMYTHFFVITVEYEIKGPKGQFCEVFGKVLDAPKAVFVDKEMTCLYDNTLQLDKAMGDLSLCAGPLVDVLREEFGSSSS